MIRIQEYDRMVRHVLRAVLAGCAVAVVLCEPASAIHRLVEIDTPAGGFTFDTDGWINGQVVYENGEARPSNVNGGFLGGDTEAFRIRAGGTPSHIGFTLGVPKTGDVSWGGRVAFYEGIQNARVRNGTTGFEIREVNLTANGPFGQILLGRANNLFLWQGLVTDTSIVYGVGAQGPVGGNAGTFGHIGYGYLYPNFGAQVRYTSPDMAGVQVAVSLTDPSEIRGSGQAATKLKYPGVEGHLSYTKPFTGGSFKVWVEGLYQEAEFEGSGDSVTASGWAAGTQVGLGGFGLALSGFGGKALGSSLMLDNDSLDPSGRERDVWGAFAEVGYSFGATRLFANMGQNKVDETSAEETARKAGGASELELARAWTVGVSHDVSAHVKLIAEYTRANNEWFAGQDQDSNVIGLGAHLFW